MSVNMWRRIIRRRAAIEQCPLKSFFCIVCFWCPHQKQVQLPWVHQSTLNSSSIPSVKWRIRAFLVRACAASPVFHATLSARSPDRWTYSGQGMATWEAARSPVVPCSAYFHRRTLQADRRRDLAGSVRSSNCRDMHLSKTTTTCINEASGVCWW